MLLSDVSLLADSLMKQHGLIDAGWHFEYDRAKSRLGCCHYDLKMITMSRLLTPSMSREEVVDTVLHEVAHALVGSKHGHDEVWKAKAIEIGCTGNRCGKIQDEQPNYAWYAVCYTCESRTGMHRAPGRVRSCGTCAPLGFSWQHRLDWEHNGEKMCVEEMPVKFQTEFFRMMEFYER